MTTRPRLLHYQATPITEPIRSAKQDAGGMKPSGLWVSVEGEDDWPSWCKAEDFCVENLAFCHEVTLRESADILWLSDAAGVDDFGGRFGVAGPFGYGRWIEWGRVARAYSGLIIAPYVWSRRLAENANWYYGWDCASGCIWDADAIASVHVLENAQ